MNQNITELKAVLARLESANRELADARRNALNLMEDAIAARKKAETTLAMLRESEEKHRVVIETTATGFVILDLKGHVLSANDEYVRLAGYERLEQILGRSVTGWTAAYDQARNAAEVLKCVASGSVRGLEVDYAHPDGTVVPIEINASILGAGDSLKIVTLCRDITERRRAQETLRRSREEFKALFDNAPFGFHELDAEGRLVRINDTELKMLGYSAEELLGQFVWKIVADEETSRRTVLAKLAGVMPPSDGFERIFRRKDGSTFPVLISDRLLKREDGAIIGVHGAVQDITERKRAEAEVERTAREWQTTFDATNDAIWILDRDHRVLRTNKTAEQFFNRPCCEMLGESCWTIVHGTTEPHPHCPFVRARQSGHREMMELQQGEHWFQIIVDPIRDPAGEYSGAVHIVSDITERKRTEEALRNSEAKYRRLYESMTDAFAAMDMAGRLQEFNPAYRAMLGYTDAELRQMTNLDLTPEKWRAIEALIITEQVLARGYSDVYEKEYQRRDGSVFPVELRVFLIRDVAGQPDGTWTIVRDITERKQAEAEMNKQAALLDAANEAIYVRTLDHVVTYWNAGAERLYGYARAEALGRKLVDLGHYDHAAFAAAHASVLNEGHWSGELARTNKAGKEFVVFCRWTLIRDEQGQPSEVLAINTDITEQKRLESQLLRAQRLESIGSLAGGIAHDMNNILSPIMMTMPLLRATVSDSDSRQMIDTVENCAQRGADVIKQLLTFARGKPGARAALPLRHLLKEMDKLIRATFPRNIQSRFNFPEDLWPVLGDVTQIHQAIMNLCVNARDAMPDGGRLTLAAENVTLDDAFAAMTPDAKPGEYVCVSVTDTGTGIAPEHVDSIFEPFFTTKEIGKGTGLGLATVLGIMRGHGGFVRVNSRVGQGTVFECYLPASPEAQMTAASDTETQPPRGQGELILVVDDEAAVREALRRTLETHGYRVLAGCEGAEALALLGRHRADVRAVVTDIMMPGMDGQKLVQSLRQLDPRLPIVGMTGLAERAGLKGLTDPHLPVLLIKPFAGAKVLAALSQALAGSNQTLVVLCVAVLNWLYI